MVDGRVPGGPPIANVIWAPGAPDSPLFVNLAGLGYKQGLAFFACDGANPLPYFVMLTGRDGALLGEAWLGDLGEYAKSYIIATSVDGSGVTVEWWGAQTAGTTVPRELLRTTAKLVATFRTKGMPPCHGKFQVCGVIEPETATTWPRSTSI